MPNSFGWDPIDLTSIPPLPHGEVHIFAISLAPDDRWKTHVRHVLNSAERARAARFRFDVDRYRFEKTRCALRLLLANYASTGAAEIEFREGQHGKPYLLDPQTELQFNVSHTRGAAVLAFARGIEVGIDVEHARRKVDLEGVAKRVFTATEQASFEGQGSATRLRQFFRLWTAKEAYLKATGSGLSCDPASIETNFASGKYHSATETNQYLPYELREIETKNAFLVCLAHQTCEPPRIRVSQLQ